MAGLGAEKPVSLSNCFVLPSPEDSYSSIMMTRLKGTVYGKIMLQAGFNLLFEPAGHGAQTPWTAAYQVSPSMGFSRQDHWSGLPFPSPMHESEK